MNVTAYKKFVVVVGFKAHFSLYYQSEFELLLQGDEKAHTLL